MACNVSDHNIRRPRGLFVSESRQGARFVKQRWVFLSETSIEYEHVTMEVVLSQNTPNLFVGDGQCVTALSAWATLRAPRHRWQGIGAVRSEE
jgi:hypothetical protein